MTDTTKHFGQQTSSTQCSVLYLVYPKKQVSYLILNKGSAAQEKKPVLSQALRCIDFFV